MSRPRKRPEDSVAAACDAAASLLARREHAARELGGKLARKGFSPPVVEQALEELRRRDWLNESRYAAFMARHRCGQGRGPRWVQAELQAQGIDGEILSQALMQADLDWDAACRRAMARLSPGESRGRLQQKLYQRGFEAGQIQAALQVQTHTES